jgi:hypothetical protein
MVKTAFPANPAMLANPAYLATIHQFHCLLMADADGAHPDPLDHPVHPDLLDLLVPKEAPDPLAVLAKLAVLAHLDLLAVLDLPAQTANPDLLATVVRMRPQAAKAMLAEPVVAENPDLLVHLAIVALLAKLAEPANPDHPAQLEAPAKMAEKDRTAHLVHLAAPARMPNTARAPIVPRKLKQPTANSTCRQPCLTFDREKYACSSSMHIASMFQT